MLHLFKTARLKLTLWYLFIIMIISFSFSGVIYRGVSAELERRFTTIEQRLELRARGYLPPEGQIEFFLEDMQEAKLELITILLYTNGAIFILSFIAGYFLAGKTLYPIEKALEDQKRFVGDASHELKTPLTGLHTTLEVALRDKYLTLPKAKVILKDSLKEVQRLSSLTNALLILARYTQDEKNLEFEEVSLSDAIANSFTSLSPIAKKKHISVLLSQDHITINVHKDSIEKLFTILLDNSIKYTPKKGTVTVSIVKRKSTVTIAVADTGIGISKRELPHVFKRFYRSDESRTVGQAEGFGLGLSIAKRIIQLHKGTISVKSVVGKGSTFTVELPLNH